MLGRCRLCHCLFLLGGCLCHCFVFGSLLLLGLLVLIVAEAMIFSVVLGCCTSLLGHSRHLQSLLKHVFYGLMVTRRRRRMRLPMHLTRRPLHQHRRQFILEVATVILFCLLRGRRLRSERFDSLWLGIVFIVIVAIAVKDCNFDFTVSGFLFLLLGGSGGGAGSALLGSEG